MPYSIATLTLSNALNESIQVGDALYYVPTSTTGNFNTSQGAGVSNVIRFGVVTSFTSGAAVSTIDVLYDSSVDSTGTQILPSPTGGEFLMFERDKVNTSGLIGYYADVQFVNNSREYAELFSVGSEIFESSK